MMTITKIDSETALNLDAVASIKFSGAAQEFAATVNFLSTGTGSSFISETFTGEAARKLFEMIGGRATESVSNNKAETEEAGAVTPVFGTEFLRTKGWYFVRGADGRRYFVAFINAKGSCSMRTFDANTGRFIAKKYRAGNYQQEFADIIQSATELTVNSQPNLERDCKVSLPESVLAQLQKQAK
jgi:hypothetical protein